VGIVGIYKGEQHETVYRRLDDGHDESARLEVAKQQTLRPGSSIHSSRLSTTSTMCGRRPLNRRYRSTCSRTTRRAYGATSSILRLER
jgi:hypothetical protein